jgi:hypothetical protein
MAIMIVVMLSQGHGPFGESKQDQGKHEQSHRHEAHHDSHEHGGSDEKQGSGSSADRK